MSIAIGSSGGSLPPLLQNLNLSSDQQSKIVGFAQQLQSGQLDASTFTSDVDSVLTSDQQATKSDGSTSSTDSKASDLTTAFLDLLTDEQKNQVANSGSLFSYTV